MNVIVIILAVLLSYGSVQANENSLTGSRDDFITRLKALALLQTINGTLLSNPSATITLQNWCAEHKMTGEPRIRAIRKHSTYKPADGSIRELLKINVDEQVGYRHVQLTCGEHILSEADNWYVKSRLTSEMNKLLDTSDTPFGLVVKPLNFSRKTLSSVLLWSPLPAGWEMKRPIIDPKPLLDIPEHVLEHRALLSREDDTPFSMVIETYRRDLFAFSQDVEGIN